MDENRDSNLFYQRSRPEADSFFNLCVANTAAFLRSVKAGQKLAGSQTPTGLFH